MVIIGIMLMNDNEQKIKQAIEDVLYNHLYLPLTEGLVDKIILEIFSKIKN